MGSFLLNLSLYWKEKLYLKVAKLLPNLDNISKNWVIKWSLLRLLITSIHLKKYFVASLNLIFLFFLLWIESIWFYLSLFNWPLILCYHCRVVLLFTLRTLADKGFYHWSFHSFFSWFSIYSTFFFFRFFLFHEEIDSSGNWHWDHDLFVVSIEFFYFLSGFQSKSGHFGSSKFLGFLGNKNSCSFQKL